MDAFGNLEARWAQGFTSQNVEYVDKTTVCYTSGNYIVFLNLETKMQSVLRCPGRGVSVFTANGNSRTLAFSEQKLNPSIFVYNYPELVLKNELKAYAQLDYTSLALSDGGPYLGCCSTLPDHSITVWNWENAEPICTQPQAGKDVISLVFNPMNWLQICALGTTSITVWNVSHFPSDCESSPDPYQPLSFAVYERNLFKHVAKSLPENSCHLHCLQIITFLHRKQTGLTGKTALTNYHLKTALLHPLISKSSSMWGFESMEHRLRDVLGFLQRSLQEKRLYHVLIGNKQVPKEVKVPQVFYLSEPINLFRSLVLETELYADTVRHFQEMLKNAPALIQEHTPLLLNGGIHPPQSR